MQLSEFNKPQKLFCKFCKKECKNYNSLINHERLCKENPNRKLSPACQPGHFGYRKGMPAWNKGLSMDTDDRVKANTLHIREYYESHTSSRKGIPLSAEAKLHLSEHAKKNCYEKHFGQRKTFNYNGFNFQSSFEVTVAKNLDMCNIRWVQPKRLSYIANDGKQHHYTADFYLPDYDVYLDPKNDYLIENINPTLGYSDVEKIHWVMEQNNVKIIVLNKNELEWSAVKNKIN